MLLGRLFPTWHGVRHPNSLRTTPSVIALGVELATVSELAARILDVFREKAKSKGSGEITATYIYEVFGGAWSHDMIQAAIRYLLDRDFIAPHTYSLTAKGVVKQVVAEKGQMQ
jgi:hypothetical protein